MIVTIYLRAVLKDKTNCLAMFDSNRKGDINNLETVVTPGSKIIWTLDSSSGIKHINRIWSKETKSKLFPGILTEKSPEGFALQIPESSESALEAYIIEYILDDKDNTKVIIDPYIRIDPPPVRTTPPNPS
jgi:hypothetical protein